MSEFGQVYARSHPGASPHVIKRKYLKALDAFFGTKIKIGAAPRRPPLMRPVPRSERRTGFVRRHYGRRLRNWVSPILDTEREQYIPPSSSGLQAISDCALPDWMTEVLDLSPEGPDKVDVFYNADDKTYTLGVCGTNDTRLYQIVIRFLEFGHPFLSKLYPQIILLDGFQTDYTGLRVYDELEASEDAKTRVFDREAKKARRDFANFMMNTTCLVGYSSYREHARLLIKNPSDRIVYIIDPHGPIYDLKQTQAIVRRINELFFFRRGARHGYTQCKLLGREKRDQPYEEESCGAVAFMRAVYILFKFHTNPHKSILEFVSDDIPCVFAVFASKLLKSTGIASSYDLFSWLNNVIDEEKKEDPDRDVSIYVNMLDDIIEDAEYPTQLFKIVYTGRLENATPAKTFVFNADHVRDYGMPRGDYLLVPNVSVLGAFALAGIHPGDVKYGSYSDLAKNVMAPIYADTTGINNSQTEVHVEFPKKDLLWKAYIEGYHTVAIAIRRDGYGSLNHVTKIIGNDGYVLDITSGPNVLASSS